MAGIFIDLILLSNVERIVNAVDDLLQGGDALRSVSREICRDGGKCVFEGGIIRRLQHQRLDRNVNILCPFVDLLLLGYVKLSVD